MTDDVAARVAERLEWESARARAVAEIRESRALADEARVARAEEQRREEERPAWPDPDVVAFTAERTGQPPPPTVAEILHRAAMLPPEPQSMRGDVDPSAAYGSTARPSLMVDGREIAPRAAQRSDGWEAGLERQLARAEAAHQRFMEYMVRHRPEEAIAMARAKSTRPEGW